MLVWAFVVCTCMLHKALIGLRGCSCLSGLCCTVMYATLGADQTARMLMLVWAFAIRSCMRHKALIRLRGCTCLPGLLLYVHVSYIRH